MSTISYAQAAKGQATTPAGSQQASPAQPPNTQANDEVSTASPSVIAPSVASSDVESPDVSKNGQSQAEVTLPRQDAETVEDSAPSPTSTVEQSSKASPESDTTTADSNQQQDEKASRSGSRRSIDGPDSRKGRKGKKGRNNDKEAQNEQQQQQQQEEKEKEKIVLSEAPLPAVNIWKQRQETRAKQAPAAVSAPSTASTNGAESKKPQPAQEDGDAQLVNGAAKDKSAKKGSDQSRNGEHGQRRTAPRGARGNEKDDKSSGNLPSVEDTSAWPEPKAAASSDATTQKAQAKPAAAEREGREEPRQQKTWQKMDVHHNVLFNTQFPTRGGHRARGGARGGREAGATRESQASNGGAQNAANDKPATVNGASAAKGSTFHPRENNASTRATSQNSATAATKRAPVEGSTPKDQRKLSVSAQADSGREPASDTAASTTKKPVSHRAPPGDIGLLNTDSGSAVHKTGAQERPKPSDSGKDGQNSNHQQHTGRSDRTRGSFRGRGGQNGATGHHVQQNSYTQNGQYSGSSFQPRQNPSGPSTSHSGQFSGYGQQTRGRGGGQHRWNGPGRHSSTSAGFPPRPSPAVGEVPVQHYVPSYQPFIPQQPIYNEDLLRLVKDQVEYYFSLENLLKDMWLRSHMDVQGFVKLSLVASFRRVEKLTTGSGGLDLLRAACFQSELVEFVIGEDQQERLRSRERWRDFVIPAAQRIGELQHDEKINFTSYPSPSQLYATYGPPPVHAQYPVASPVGMYPPFAVDQVYQPGYMNGGRFEQNGNGSNGLNGHHHPHDTPLSALVPDFNPASGPVNLDSFNNISDSRVENLIILDRVSSDAAGAGAAGYISNSYHPVMNGVAPQSNNIDATNGVDNSSRTTTWFKGQPAESPVERPYLHVKQAALAQRKQASQGATPEEMRHLYEFWSNMLLTAFNDKVYDEFRSLSLEDAAQQKIDGLRFLVEFLKNVHDVNVRKPWLQNPIIPEILQHHYHEALNVNENNAAPAVDHHQSA